MATTLITPYTGAMALINKANIPTWVNDYDAQRLASYALYENIYWTRPDTFKLQQRGGEKNPIYIPSGRVICNTMDRYTGVDWEPILDTAFGTPVEQAAALVAFTDLFSRERMGTKYNSNKLFGVMKGDWAFYITGDVAKPQGSRLSIQAIDMASVFPIEDPDNVERILGYDIAEEILIGADTRIKRTRYLKSDSPDYPLAGAGTPGGPISFEVTAFEIQGWEDPENQKEVQFENAVPAVALAGITKLPVYHIKNFDEPGNPFGSSEMRGIERLFAAVNQAITDEELSLALEGLGMYKSSKEAPAGGVWPLGPGRVVQDPDFERVNGINTVGPFQDHLTYLHGQMDEVTGISDVAKGKVDVTVAQSGIALTIRMGPILTASKKKDTGIKEVMNNFLFDLRDWIQIYEGVNCQNVRLVSRFGEKMPSDNATRFAQLLQMYTAVPPLITAAYFRDACREMGMDIPVAVTGIAIANEQAQMNAAMDPYRQRIEEELNDPGNAGGAGGVPPTSDPTTGDPGATG